MRIYDYDDVKHLATLGKIVGNKMVDGLGRPSVKGEIGRCVRFNGSSDKILADGSTGLNITGNLTISFWVKQDEIKVDNAVIIRNGFNTPPFNININNQYITWSMHADGAYKNIYANNGSLFNTGAWYHVVVTRRIEGLNCYRSAWINNVNKIDDNLLVMTTGVTGTDNGRLGIGYDTHAGTFLDKASLFDIRVFNEELTTDEITALYNFKEDIALSNLVAWWKLQEDNIATLAEDSSGNGYHGTFTIASATYSLITQNLRKFDDDGVGRDVVSGSGLIFDASTTVITLPTAGTAGNITGANEIIEFCFKRNGDSGSTYHAIYTRLGAAVTGFQIYINKADNILRFYTSAANSFGYVVDTNWHKYKIVTKATTADLWVDDVYYTTITGVTYASVTATGHTIGAYGGYKTNGTIAGLKITKSTGVDLEYRLDEGHGLVAYDSSGNNKHGTISGTAVWETQNLISFADQYGYGKGIQLLTDGDMEQSGTTSWSAYAATLSKVASTLNGGSQALRITAPSGFGEAYQTILNSGLSYRIRGYARGDGASAQPQVKITAGMDWTGTTSTSWQYFDITATAAATIIELFSSTTGWVEFNDVKIEAVDVKYPVVPVGKELIVNGEFNTSGTGWSTTAPCTITWQSDGTLLINRNNGGTTDQCYQNITTVVGKKYIFECEVKSSTYGVSLWVGSTEYIMSARAIFNKKFKVSFTATATTTKIGITVTNSVTATAYINNVTVREMNVPDKKPNLFINGDAAVDDTSMFYKNADAGVYRIKERPESNKYVWRLQRISDISSSYPLFTYSFIGSGKYVRFKCKVRTDGYHAAIVYYYDGSTKSISVPTSYVNDKWYSIDVTFTTSTLEGIFLRVVSGTGNNAYAEFKDIEVLDLSQNLTNGYRCVVASPNYECNYTEYHTGRVQYNAPLAGSYCGNFAANRVQITNPGQSQTGVIRYKIRFKTGADVTTTQRLFYQDQVAGASSAYASSITIAAGNLQFYVYTTGGDSRAIAVAINTEYEIDAIFVNSTFYVKLNNVMYTKAHSTPGAPKVTTANFYIGGEQDGLYPFGGQIYDFQIYGASNDLLGYYPLSEGSGSIAYDVSGNTNHGTWVGTPAYTTQDNYHHNLLYGWNDSSGVYVPGVPNTNKDAAGTELTHFGNLGHNGAETTFTLPAAAALITSDTDETFFTAGSPNTKTAALFTAPVAGKIAQYINNRGRYPLTIFNQTMDTTDGLYAVQGSGGASAGVLCGATTDLDLGLNDLDMECWIIIPTGYTPVSYEAVCGKAYVGLGVGRYYIGFSATDIFAAVETATLGTSNIFYAVASIPKDVPVHIRLVIERTGYMRLLVDNVSVGTPVDVSTASAENLALAAKFCIAGTNYGPASKVSFRGRVWGVKCTIGGVLKGWWPCNRNTYDITGNDYHGTWTVDKPIYTKVTQAELKSINYENPLRDYGSSVGSNLITQPNDMTNAAWLLSATPPTRAYGFTDPIGTSTASKITDLYGGGTRYIYTLVSGLTCKCKLEPSLWIKPVTLAGNITIQNAYDANYGNWTIDYTKLVSGIWNYVDKSHPAVTVVAEWVIYSSTFTAMRIQTADASTTEIHLWGVSVRPYFIAPDVANPGYDVAGNVLTLGARNGLSNGQPLDFSPEKYEILKQLDYNKGV